MDFKLGEFVRFVDEKMEGYITRIYDNGLLGVTGEDDFEIPVPASKVTHVHGHSYDKKTGGNVVATVQAPLTPDEFITKGISIAVAPDTRKASIVNFYLVNDTSFQLFFSLSSERNKEIRGEFAGIVNPSSATQVFTASLPELDYWPSFIFQVAYFTTHNQQLPAPFTKREKFKSKDFSGQRKLISSVKLDAWSIRLDEEEVKIDPEKLKESFFKPKEEKKEISKPLKELDLHIEKLIDDYQGRSKTEILKIQLDAFKKALDSAIVHKQSSIVFIHGVGNGTLRNEIHKQLGRNNHVRTFMDARKEKFGYGATEVILK